MRREPARTDKTQLPRHLSAHGPGPSQVRSICRGDRRSELIWCVIELQKPSFTGRRHCQETPRTARAQERDFKKVTAELETLKQDYKNLENRYHRSQETLRTLESSIVEKQHCNEGLKAELELIYCRFAGMKEEINQAEDRCRQTSRTLEETTVELRATHRFLSQADTLSGADIIDMVDSLNSGIFQLAAGVAESWSSEFSRPGSPNWQQLMLEGLDVEAHRVTRGSIGEGLQAILTRRLIPGSELDPPDPTPIQIALQVCLVQCCVNIMVGWTFTKHVDDILRGLHTKLLGAGKRLELLVTRYLRVAFSSGSGCGRKIAFNDSSPDTGTAQQGLDLKQRG